MRPTRHAAPLSFTVPAYCVPPRRRAGPCGEWYEVFMDLTALAHLSKSTCPYITGESMPALKLRFVGGFCHYKRASIHVEGGNFSVGFYGVSSHRAGDNHLEIHRAMTISTCLSQSPPLQERIASIHASASTKVESNLDASVTLTR